MRKPVRFSLEYDVFEHRTKGSFKKLVESYIYNGDFSEYLEFVHNSNRAEPAYRDLTGFRRDIDRVLDVRTNIGEAFLDGGALAIDSINLFSPDLLLDIHAELVGIRNELTARHLGRNPDESDEAEYVSALRSIGSDLTQHYIPDYSRALSDISRTRGYAFIEQHLSVVHGFTFVMTAADRAYAKDMKEFGKEVTSLSHADDSLFYQEINEAIKRHRRNTA